MLISFASDYAPPDLKYDYRHIQARHLAVHLFEQLAQPTHAALARVLFDQEVDRRVGQHDVGVARGRGPGELVHHERIEPRKRLAQAIERRQRC